MSGNTNLFEDLASSTHELRGSLTELLGGVGVDARRAQVVSRRLQLDKSLAWKISNIVKSDQPSAALKHLPGSNAFEILMSAAKDAGATQRSIKRAETAYKAIKDVVERHTGDRPTLELVMDSMPQNSGERLVVSRKLAFRGNSGIWGVQAKTRVNTALLAPSADDPNMIDTANVGGWVGFRRLRADSRWGLFRVQVFDTRPEVALPRAEPLDPQESPTGPMLLRDFCSPTLPPIQAVPDPNGDVVYELGPSSIGNSGAFSCFFGSKISKIAPRQATKENDRGEYAATISAPVESLQFDLLVHRDCAFALNATTMVYGTLDLTPGTRNDRDLIPIELARAELGSFPPVVDTPRVQDYGRLIDTVMKRCGWNASDFIGVRYTLEYPPFPSSVVISFPLAQ